MTKLGVYLLVLIALAGECLSQYNFDDESHGWGKPKQITSLPQYETQSSPQGSYPQRGGGGGGGQQNLWWQGQNAFQRPPGHPGVVLTDPKQNSGRGAPPQSPPFGGSPPPRPGFNPAGSGGPTTPGPVAVEPEYEDSSPSGVPSPLDPEARPVSPGVRETPDIDQYNPRDPVPPQQPEKTQYGGWSAQGQSNQKYQQSGFGHPPADNIPAGTAPGCELRNKADCHRNNPVPSQNYELPQQSYRPQGHGNYEAPKPQQNYQVAPPNQGYQPPRQESQPYEPIQPPNQGYEPPPPEPQPQNPPPQQVVPIPTPNQDYEPPPPQPQPQSPSPQQPYSPVSPPPQGYQPPPPEQDYQPSNQQPYSPPAQQPYSPPPQNYQPTQSNPPSNQAYQPSGAYQRPSQPQNQYQSSSQSSSQQNRPYSPPQAPRRPPAEEAPAVPYPGCPAAMKCVQDNYCSRIGLIEPQPIQLSTADRLNRVALVSCSEPMTGIVGVCCRDPNYVDPWPDMQSKNHHHHDKGHSAQGQHQPLRNNHLQTGNPYSGGQGWTMG